MESEQIPTRKPKQVPQCCECRHYMLLCGAPWCYRYHVRTTAGGHCDAGEVLDMFKDERPFDEHGEIAP